MATLLGLLRDAGVGVALGVLTGVPLGVVNVAVLERARRDGWRLGAALGLGGAIADAVLAGLAVLGVSAALTSSRGALLAIAAVGTASIVAYAVTLWRRSGVAAASAPPPARAGGHLRAALRGASLTLPNPGALLGWLTIAAAVWPDGGPAQALAAALGVLVGSALWFGGLARLAARSRTPLSPWWSRIAALMLLGFAAVAIVRVAVT